MSERESEFTPKWPTESLLASEYLKYKKKQKSNQPDRQKEISFWTFFHFHFYLVCLNLLDLSTAALYEREGARNGRTVNGRQEKEERG